MTRAAKAPSILVWQVIALDDDVFHHPLSETLDQHWRCLERTSAKIFPLSRCLSA